MADRALQICSIFLFKLKDLAISRRIAFLLLQIVTEAEISCVRVLYLVLHNHIIPLYHCIFLKTCLIKIVDFLAVNQGILVLDLNDFFVDCKHEDDLNTEDGSYDEECH